MFNVVDAISFAEVKIEKMQALQGKGCGGQEELGPPEKPGKGNVHKKGKVPSKIKRTVWTKREYMVFDQVASEYSR